MDLKEKYILQINLVTTIKNYNLAYGPHKEGTFIALLLILACIDPKKMFIFQVNLITTVQKTDFVIKQFLLLLPLTKQKSFFNCISIFYSFYCTLGLIFKLTSADISEQEPPLKFSPL